MAMNYYDRGGLPIDMEQWAILHGDPDYRKIGLWHGEDGITVSTVWLGIDHRFVGDGDPIIFETMIFGPEHLDGEMTRYTTHRDAQEGHQHTVDNITSGEPIWFLHEDD